MNINLHLRQASESDLNFLLDLRIKTMNEHYVSSNLPTSKEINLQRILYRFEKANIILFHNEAIGLLKIDYDHEKIEVLQIQIHPHHQGKGLGREILKMVIKGALFTQKNIILSVLKTNPAQKLYSGLGFNITEENEHSYMMEFSN